MAAHQALPSLGFSRQEHWSGLPFPSPMHESEKEKGSHSVVSDSSDPMDCSLPGSSVHGIFQAKVLEWAAIVKQRSKVPQKVKQNFHEIQPFHSGIYLKEFKTSIQMTLICECSLQYHSQRPNGRNITNVHQLTNVKQTVVYIRNGMLSN